MALLAQWVNDDLVISQKSHFLPLFYKLPYVSLRIEDFINWGQEMTFLTYWILCDIYIYVNTRVRALLPDLYIYCDFLF